MKRLVLLYFLMRASLAAAQPACSCELLVEKINMQKLDTLPTCTESSAITSKLPLKDTINATRAVIERIDELIKNHFDKNLKQQLRGLDGGYQDRKYTPLAPHVLFLCQLNSLTNWLNTTNVHFANTQKVHSISPIFQAYLNSLRIYYDQSCNLVNWPHLTKRFGKAKKPYVLIHEGSINIYNQSYIFVEICKNNLLKEFSIIDLAYDAELIKQRSIQITEQMDLLKKDLDRKNQLLEDRVGELRTKLDSMQQDPLLQTIREARQTHKRRRIIIKLN